MVVLFGYRLWCDVWIRWLGRDKSLCTLLKSPADIQRKSLLQSLSLYAGQQSRRSQHNKRLPYSSVLIASPPAFSCARGLSRVKPQTVYSVDVWRDSTIYSYIYLSELKAPSPRLANIRRLAPSLHYSIIHNWFNGILNDYGLWSGKKKGDFPLRQSRRYSQTTSLFATIRKGTKNFGYVMLLQHKKNNCTHGCYIYIYIGVSSKRQFAPFIIRCTSNIFFGYKTAINAQFSYQENKLDNASVAFRQGWCPCHISGRKCRMHTLPPLPLSLTFCTLQNIT